ncbi:MAG: glycoside hydrolase family 13 protein [Alphaproteobacteria bacterium]|nr:glycoside hydrolase family 13 protein [Alphaproteobacteria bacterium]
MYQVFPDRFAPPDAPPPPAPPRRARPWSKTPRKGRYLPSAGVWSHELHVWGGTLTGVRAHLDHVAALADVLYLNPIHDALTNHRYDARDWTRVDPLLGTRDDVVALAEDLHRRGLRLMLDGVFNHLGRTAPAFQRALTHPDAPERAWFDLDARYTHGARSWFDVFNLPEVRLEHPAVRKLAFEGPDSVVQRWLREGADGWRLDVAHDLGPALCAAIRQGARAAKPDAWVVGEVWNDPRGWLDTLDGVLNMHLRVLLLELVDGTLAPARFGRLLERHLADAGIEGLLRSWLVLDNHDTPRLASRLPKPWQRRLAQTLQLALPGSPVLYYGVEIGMTGDGDPTNRAPMRWDEVPGHPELERLRTLLDLRRRLPALRFGDATVLDGEGLVAFTRHTDRVEETVLVLVNPGPEPVTERLALRDPRLMSGSPLEDALHPGETVHVDAGTVRVSVPARGARLLTPRMPPAWGYDPYRRLLQD